jgi:hypothetical protein
MNTMLRKTFVAGVTGLTLAATMAMVSSTADAGGPGWGGPGWRFAPGGTGLGLGLTAGPPYWGVYDGYHWDNYGANFGYDIPGGNYGDRGDGCGLRGYLTDLGGSYGCVPYRSGY